MLEDHEQFSGELASRRDIYDAAVALFDPYQFREIKGVLPQWLEGLASVVKPGGRSAILVFEFSRQVHRWPDWESASLRLAGTFQRWPYLLALYANKAGHMAAQAPLEEMGWKFSPAAVGS